MDHEQVSLYSFLLGIGFLLLGFISIMGPFYVVPNGCQSASEFVFLGIGWEHFTVHWILGCDVYGTSVFTVVGFLYLIVSGVSAGVAGFN